MYVWIEYGRLSCRRMRQEARSTLRIVLVSGGQLIWLGSHLEKAAFSGGPYLLTEIEASLGPFSHNTNIYCDNWRKYQKKFRECFRGPLKTLWRPIIAHPWHRL